MLDPYFKDGGCWLDKETWKRRQRDFMKIFLSTHRSDIISPHFTVLPPESSAKEIAETERMERHTD